MSISPESLTTPELLAEAKRLALGDPTAQSDERWRLVQHLHRLGEPAVFEQAAQWCASPDPLLRCLGADVLAQLNWDDDYPFKDRSEPILDGLLSDSQDDVVSSALFAHGHLGSGQSVTVSALRSHACASVRHALAYCLLTRDDAVARKTLIELSRDADSDVRDWATFGLGTQSKVDSQEIRAALLARLEDEDDDTRCEAMVGLAARLDERALPFIEEELAKENVYQLAIEAAGLLGDERFIPRLESLLASYPEDDQIREAVMRCRS